MKPDITINDQIDNFNHLLTNLLNLDEVFKDEEKAMLLIRSLLDKLDHLCITLIHEKKKLSHEEVCGALITKKFKNWIRKRI